MFYQTLKLYQGINVCIKCIFFGLSRKSEQILFIGYNSTIFKMTISVEIKSVKILEIVQNLNKQD